MQDFILIILIFLEIAGLYFAIFKIIELDKKIQDYSKIIAKKGKIINEIHLKIQKNIRNINKVVAFLKNEKLWKIKRAISASISIIELVIVLRSFNFRKGVKFNLKSFKKLLFTRLSKKIIKKIFSFIALSC